MLALNLRAASDNCLVENVDLFELLFVQEWPLFPDSCGQCRKVVKVTL